MNHFSLKSAIDAINKINNKPHHNINNKIMFFKNPQNSGTIHKVVHVLLINNYYFDH